MFFLDFLNDVKKQNEELRKIIRTHYKIFEKNSHIHYERLKESVQNNTAKDNELVEMLPGKTCHDICSLLESEKDKNVVKSYLYIFLSLVSIDEDENVEVSISILEKVLEIIKGIQEGRNVDEDMKEILDDSIYAHLNQLREYMNHNSANVDTNEILGMLENSKIGSLAKEISNEIDLKELDISNPEQLLDFRNLTNSNNVLGSIISKVGGKIKNKIDSGELSQTDLVKEAMSFVGMVNGAGTSKGDNGGFDFMSMLNNPMFGDLLSGLNMGGSANVSAGSRVQVDKQKVQNMQTRDRLRRKLQERQENKSTE
jgi:hypothetical protein